MYFNRTAVIIAASCTVSGSILFPPQSCTWLHIFVSVHGHGTELSDNSHQEGNNTSLFGSPTLVVALYGAQNTKGRKDRVAVWTIDSWLN